MAVRTSNLKYRSAGDVGVLAVSLLVAFALTCTACGGDDGDGGTELQCVEDLPSDCAPGFEPTWNNVYANVVRQSCVGSGTSCHGPGAKQGGLELSSASGALAALLGDTDGKPRVLPNDPACSTLMIRLETDDPDKRMPRLAGQLTAATRCAVQTWIEMGAKP